MTIAEQLIKEGMQKGIIEGKRKIARNLLKLGFSAEQVAEAAELSTEEVMQLNRYIIHRWIKYGYSPIPYAAYRINCQLIKHLSWQDQTVSVSRLENLMRVVLNPVL